jgi:enterochelin esterase-like enzyme/lysophospholipase L1-like esterase
MKTQYSLCTKAQLIAVATGLILFSAKQALSQTPVLAPPQSAALPNAVTPKTWPLAIAPASDEAKKIARTQVQTLTVKSTLMKREMAFNHILPQGYATSGLRYPVLYLLHGSSDNHLGWNNKTGIAAYISDLPLIVVMPDGGPDSRYINSPGYGPYADYILTELVPHIDRTYQTIARRDGRALMGLSMGGYGAWRLGLSAPQDFAAVASLSGSFKWGENEWTDKQYHARAVTVYGSDGPDAAAMYRADRIWAHVEKHITAGGQWQGPALYFNIGAEDHLLEANRVIRQRLEERKVPFRYAEYSGGHTWSYWDEHVRDALGFSLRYLTLPIQVASAAATAPTSTSKPSGALRSSTALARSAKLLKVNKRLTIGYIGGSLTSGSGASNPEVGSWRAKTTNWFKTRFPDADIQVVNAAIGGTGSDLSVYRIGSDLLIKKPDLVFLEFAVNDGGGERVQRSMEGMVRQIWKVNPMADIVFVYTTKRDYEKHHIEGTLPPSAALHDRVAQHYNIPVVDIGQALWEEIKAGKHTWESLLPDNVHPNDTGYALYSDAIITFLKAQDWNGMSAGPVALAAPLSDHTLDGARFPDAWDIAADGWTKEEQGVGRYPRRIAANQPGTELSYKFNGTAIGFYYLAAADSGDVEWSLDGSEWKRASTWSRYGVDSSRGYGMILNDKLRAGEHHLRLRVLGDNHPQSKCTWVRLGAFMVNDASTRK